MKKYITYISFALLAMFIFVLGITTWIEHIHGTEYTQQYCYGSWWFNCLLTSLVAISAYIIICQKIYKRLAVFGLHLALIIIVAGAAITRFTGEAGIIHLRQNEAENGFINEETRENVTLPFTITLHSFRIEYYPGTHSPSDYVSHIQITGGTGSATHIVSMNHIVRHCGYRFYQTSFDEDRQGTILSVNHDPWGVGVTYTGYFLLFLSMAGILFSRNERFRFLLKKLANQKLTIVLALAGISLFASPGKTFSQNILTKDNATLSSEQADAFGNLLVEYQGRICPLQTLAIDFTTKLTGKPKYKYASAEQVLLGWLFFPDKWQHISMFEIKNDELRRLINPSGKAAFTDFFDGKGQYKLQAYVKKMYASGNQNATTKEAAKLDEKIQLIAMLQYGKMLNLFPLAGKNAETGVKWYAATDSISRQSSKIERLFVQNFFPLYTEYINQNKPAEALALINRLKCFQLENMPGTSPSDSQIKAERFYNSAHLFSWLFKINLTLGCIGMFFFILFTIKNKSLKCIGHWFRVCLMVSFAITTAGILLRAYISQHFPISNGYETMVFIAWCALLTGIVARKYSFLMQMFALLLSGFVLLVAHIGSMNPQITPLVPVLQSPLLSIHVSLIMMSYGLCGFMLLNSLTSFILRIIKKPDAQKQIVMMKELSELFMYPAAFLLGGGIFVGAIWANVSWGRYWGWDPKEVWALITFLLMSLSFHGKSLKWLQKPFVYHVFVVFIFLAVLMTYFGVNFILGGRHSYGG